MGELQNILGDIIVVIGLTELGAVAISDKCIAPIGGLRLTCNASDGSENGGMFLDIHLK